MISILKNSINSLSTCSLEVESTSHFHLHSHHFISIKLTLFEEFKIIDKNLPKLSDDCLTKILLYSDNKYNDIQNRSILHYSMMLIIDSKQYGRSLFYNFIIILFWQLKWPLGFSIFTEINKYRRNNNIVDKLNSYSFSLTLLSLVQ